MSQNKMFPLNFSYEKFACFNSIVKDPSLLWHHRSGHLNFGSVSHMSEKKHGEGIPNSKNENHICEACILGKQHHKPFPVKSFWRATKPLELVRTDICGSMQTISNEGNRYFLTFIDD